MRPRQDARHLAGVLLCTLLLGCATLQTTALRQQPLGTHSELIGVPFFPQEDHQCGPAALATVLAVSGVAVKPAELSDLVYLPSRAGSLPVELLAATRRYGRLAYTLAPSLQDLLDEVRAGTPVLVLQNLGLSLLPVWHYAVVVGFDPASETILLRSGREQRQTLSFTTFEYTWARSGYWAMLALSPERLPATATEPAFVNAAFDLEQTGHPYAAQQAYQTALTRWPNSLAARMGLGNSAYRLGDLTTAEAAFRLAAQAHAEDWRPLNNLAMVLSATGRTDEAMSVAQQAVALSPAGATSEAQATLALIRRHQPATQR